MKVLFPGSFDPIHEGHLKVIERASRVFDDVVVLVAQNPLKNHTDIIERTSNVKKVVARLKLNNVSVDFWNGQVMEYYEKYYFDAVLRSIRNASDLEWEESIANEYRKQNIDADVLYFIAENELKSFKSSSLKSKDEKPQKSIFAFDVDGTILNDEKQLTWSIKRVFRKLQQQNHIPIIVTGRAPSQVFALCKELNFNGHIIGNNGGSIYDLAKKEYQISTKIIPFEDLELIIQKAYELQRELIWSNGREVYRVYFGKNPRKEIKDKLYFIGGSLDPNYDDWEKCKHTLNDGVIQVSIKAESWMIDKIKKELNPKISKEVYGVETSRVYYQVSHNINNKYNAIKIIQSMYKVKNEDTYAFGDSENDQEMIVKVGHGIAMGNAKNSLKKAAKEVIGDNNKDSIEDYLIRKGFISE